VANGVTELCSLLSKNIHSTWYQQFKHFTAHKGVVAAGFPCVSRNYYVKFPAFTIMNSFVFLPSLSQPLIYLSGGNYMFTTGAQTLQPLIYVHGIKYAPEVCSDTQAIT